MGGHCRRWFVVFVFLDFFDACAHAQSPQAVTTKILVDSLAAAGGAVAPAGGWASSIGDLNDIAQSGSLVSQGNYLGALEYGVNWGTVKVEGKLGGPVAAGLTQGALDFGDTVVAPYLADQLVSRFPGVFIPAQTVTVVQANPFGIAPPRAASEVSSPAATNNGNPFGSVRLATRTIQPNRGDTG